MGIGKRATIVSSDEIGVIVQGLGDASQFLSRLAFTCDRIAGGLQEFDRQRSAVRHQGLMPDPLKIAAALAKSRETSHISDALSRSDFSATHRGGVLISTTDAADRSILEWSKSKIQEAMRSTYGKEWRIAIQ